MPPKKFSRNLLTLTLFLVFVSSQAGTVMGQSETKEVSPSPKFDKFSASTKAEIPSPKFDKFSILSNALAIASTAMDIHLQRRNEKFGLVCEGNSLLRSSDGCSLSPAKAWGASLAVIGLSNLGQALTPGKYKRFWETIRIGVAGAHGIGISMNLSKRNR